MSMRECKVLSQGNKFLTLNKVNGSCELRYEIIHDLSFEECLLIALHSFKKVDFHFQVHHCKHDFCLF